LALIVNDLEHDCNTLSMNGEVIVIHF